MFLRRVQGAQTGRARMMVEAQQTDCGHAVCFYERDSDLIGRVAAYLTAGEADAGASIVIATEEHRRVFELTLEKAGIDAEKAQKLGTYIALDASVTLSQICVDGRVDGEAFGSVVGGLVRQVARTGRPIRAYGEMVSLLWEAGDVMATIELERLWNDLRREVAFSLLSLIEASRFRLSESPRRWRRSVASTQPCFGPPPTVWMRQAGPASVPNGGCSGLRPVPMRHARLGPSWSRPCASGVVRASKLMPSWWLPSWRLTRSSTRSRLSPSSCDQTTSGCGSRYTTAAGSYRRGA